MSSPSVATPLVSAAPSFSTADVTSCLVSSRVTFDISFWTASVESADAMGARAALPSTGLVAEAVDAGVAVPNAAVVPLVVAGRGSVLLVVGDDATPSIFSTTVSAACSRVATAEAARLPIALKKP